MPMFRMYIDYMIYTIVLILFIQSVPSLILYHVKVDKELRGRRSNFEDLREKAEQLVSEQVSFAVPKINITVE